MPSFIAHPWDLVRVGDFLASGLQAPKWSHFRAAVAFVRRSGTKYIAPYLEAFAARAGTQVNISVGVDMAGSTYEGVKDLIDSLGGHGKLWVYRNLNNTFHPKVFLFRNANEADVVVGSGNLTKGGLFENSEAFVRHVLDLTNADDAALLNSIEAALDRWSVFAPKLCLPLDYAVLDELHESGDVPKEAEARATVKKAMTALTATAKKKSPFAAVKTPSAPPAPPGAAPALPAAPPAAGIAAPAAPLPLAHGKGHTFGMILQNTDVGVGQLEEDKEKRSPEVFIPLLALDQLPNFWNWKSKQQAGASYKADVAWRAKNSKWIAEQTAKNKKKGAAANARPLDKLDWPKVRIKLAGQPNVIEATIWFNPKKRDIRIRQERLRSAGEIGDILLIRRAPNGAGYDYDMEVVKTADPTFAATFAKLATKVRNSPKHIGFF